VSPAARGAILTVVQGLVGASQRRICEAVAWCRSSLRYAPRPRPRQERLKELLPQLARAHPWFGCPRITDEVRDREGRIGENTVHRLWKLLKLQVRPRKRKRVRRAPRLGALGLRAGRPNHVWCLDFMKDHLLNGRSFRMLSVVDEHTRECLALLAGWSFTAEDVVATLEWLCHRHGAPAHLRSDNGPEFIARVVGRWAEGQGVRLVRSAPHSPWQNPFIESFNATARREFTEWVVFGSLEEAGVLCDVHRRWYNEVRRHSSLGRQTPAAFAAKVRTFGPGLGQPSLAGAAA
jgi:putative transposase